MQDANWNVVALFNPASGGSIVERYAYTPYGVVQFLSAGFAPLSGNISAYSWEILFCGYRYDAAVGLYLVRNRWLNPPLGCWLSRDPAASAARGVNGGVDVNLLRYLENKPAIAPDPSGLGCNFKGVAATGNWGPAIAIYGSPTPSGHVVGAGSGIGRQLAQSLYCQRTRDIISFYECTCYYGWCYIMSTTGEYTFTDVDSQTILVPLVGTGDPAATQIWVTGSDLEIPIPIAGPATVAWLTMGIDPADQTRADRVCQSPRATWPAHTPPPPPAARPCK